jgi:hypothetical protein
MHCLPHCYMFEGPAVDQDRTLQQCVSSSKINISFYKYCRAKIIHITKFQDGKDV